MTTHTDRKSGFGSFPAKGVQPIPTEPVQVYEDPGAAYWKEASDFMDSFDKTHTDRIRQMAQEAGFDIESTGIFDPTTGGVSSGDMTPNLARFAQLVAEDCAGIVDDETDKAMDECMLGMDAYHAAEYSTKAIRARYSLKD